jgi:hypothetical protein
MDTGAFSKRSTDAFYSLTFLAAAYASAMVAIEEARDAMKVEMADEHIISAVWASQLFLIIILARIYVVIHEIDNGDTHDSSFAPVMAGIDRKPIAAVVERCIRLLLLCSIVFVVKPGFGIDHIGRDFSFYLRDIEWVADLLYKINVNENVLQVGRDFWRSIVYTGSVIFCVAALFFAWDTNAILALSFDTDGITARRMYTRSLQLKTTDAVVNAYERSQSKSIASMLLWTVCLISGFGEYILSAKFWDRLILLILALGMCLLPALPEWTLVVLVTGLTLSAIISLRSVPQPVASYVGLVSAAPLFVLRPAVQALAKPFYRLKNSAKQTLKTPLNKLVLVLDRVVLPWPWKSQAAPSLDDGGAKSCHREPHEPEAGEVVEASKPR